MTRKKQKKDTKNIAQKIKIAMLESGFNQNTLAKELGLTQGAVSKWLNGTSEVSTKLLYAIAAATGKPINYFFDNSGSIKGNNNVVSSNNNSVPADVQKDIKLLSTQVELLSAKIQLIEAEIKLLKKKTVTYSSGYEQ